MYLLSIDQGNTRTKFALFRDGLLDQAWAVETRKDATAAELASAAFRLAFAPIPIGLCTVVPKLRLTWEAMARAAGCPLTVFTGRSSVPLANAYATPDTLGPDRLLAAVAAVQCAGAPVVVASLGTATVVDAVSADHTYLGGMIAPGIGTAAQALTDSASALFPVEWRVPEFPLGRTSDDAIAHGLFYHAVGGVQAMVQAARTALNTDAPLVLTGGWAPHLAPYLTGVAVIDEHLVLRGIAVSSVYRR